MQPTLDIQRPTRNRSFFSVRSGHRKVLDCASPLALSVCLLLGALATARADTLTVTNLNDSGPGSLRQAIADAAPGDTVDFAVTGTITLTNGQLFIYRSINIDGPGVTNLTVSGNNASRVFSFNNVTATVSGLSIANGRMINDFGAGSGAGINNNLGSLRVSDCTLINNRAATGGGLANFDGMVTIIRSQICSNNLPPPVFASGGGGGIYNYSGTLDILNSAIFGNRTGGSGGGIANEGMLRMTNSVVSGNISSNPTGRGGGIAAQGQTFIASSTVCSNAAPSAGGGIHLVSGTPYQIGIINTVLAGNTTEGNGPDFSGVMNSLDYNLVQNTNGATITNLTAHNLYNLDPKLGPLADLGGPTPTHALRFDSPALDTGHSGGLTTDQRGLPRPIIAPDNTTYPGDGSDIGAYEADPVLRISAIEKVGADIRLRFNTLYGRTNQVESKDEVTAAWNVLLPEVIGDGSAKQAVDAGAASLPQRYYRAVQLP